MFIPNKIYIYLLCFIFLSILYGCGNTTEFKSSSTGWKVNDKKGGFYYNTNFEKQETAPGMVFIEGGTYIKGRIQDDQMREWTNNPSRQHVQSFYLDETEVTNKMYVEYLFWIKKVFFFFLESCRFLLTSLSENKRVEFC